MVRKSKQAMRYFYRLSVCI